MLKKKRQESKQENFDQELSLSLTQALQAPQGVPLQQLKNELCYLKLEVSDLALLSSRLERLAELCENELFICLHALTKTIKRQLLQENCAIACANQVALVMA